MSALVADVDAVPSSAVLVESTLGTVPDAASPLLEVQIRAFAAVARKMDPTARAVAREMACERLHAIGVRGPARLLDAALGSSTPSDTGPRAASAPMLFADERDEPWPHVVDGAALLADLDTAIRRHVVMSEHAAVAAALWVVHTHALEAAEHSPRLAIVSPTKRCGKTTLLDLLGALVRRPMHAANVTAAVVFRVVEAHTPTLLVDEADTFLRESPELLGVLNSGHRRETACVLRCAGDSYEATRYATWAPVAVAAIGRDAIPDTLRDRSIVVELRRRAKNENVVPLRTSRATLADMRRRAARWVADHADDLRATSGATEALDDRAGDNWSPLLALAVAAGGEWPGRARAAALALSAGRADEADDLGSMLLTDAAEVWPASEDMIHSSTLIDRLVALDGRPWATMPPREQKLTAAKLAKLLGRWGARPRNIRLDADGVKKGYLRTELADAFVRYIMPPEGGSAPIPPLANRYNATTTEKQAQNGTFKALHGSESDLEALHDPSGKTSTCSGVAPVAPPRGVRSAIQPVADAKQRFDARVAQGLREMPGTPRSIVEELVGDEAARGTRPVAQMLPLRHETEGYNGS